MRLGSALLSSIADAVWPAACPSCGGPIEGDGVACPPCTARLKPLPGDRCAACSTPIEPPALSCPGCRKLPPGVDARIVATDYSVARPLIHALKYDRRRSLGPLLAVRLAEVLARNRYAREADVVVPVPIHRWRKRRRGFDQSHVLAEAAARVLGIPIRPEALVRLRNTPHQTGLGGADERAANVQGAFAQGSAKGVAGLRVLLVDDVITTGATVGACAAVLIAAGATRVYAAAVAHPFHVFAGGPDQPPDLSDCTV